MSDICQLWLWHLLLAEEFEEADRDDQPEAQTDPDGWASSARHDTLGEIWEGGVRRQGVRAGGARQHGEGAADHLGASQHR